MIKKALYNEKLTVSYEFLDEFGKMSKRKQAITFMSSDASDDEKYAMAQKLGELLVAPPKAIQETLVYDLVEA